MRRPTMKVVVVLAIIIPMLKATVMRVRILGMTMEDPT